MRFNWSYMCLFCLLLCSFHFSCGQNEKGTQKEESFSNASAASKKLGSSIFAANCKICHGADGKLGLNGAKDLSVSQLPLEERVAIISKGKNLMTAFGTILSPAEIDSVAVFTFQLKQATTK